MAGKTVIILGGGIGGVSAASLIRKKLSRDNRVILVNKGGKHIFLPSLLWVTFGLREPKAIQRDLSILEKTGIEIVVGDVTSVDTDNNKVFLSEKELSYDLLVVALGADLDFNKIPGLAKGCYSFYDLDNALKLNKELDVFRSGRLAVVVSDMPYKCPAAPFEAAMLIEERLRKRGVRDKIDMQVYIPTPLPMGVAGAKVGKALVGLVESKDIGFNVNMKLSSVNSKDGIMAFNDKDEVSFDFLVAVPPHIAPTAISDSKISGPNGWIPVNPNTLGTSIPNIFAIGDVTSVKLANEKMLPKAGVFANAQAEVVASNIATLINGQEQKSEFTGYGNCFIETGGKRAGMASGNFYAEPDPKIRLRSIRPWWQWAKVMVEKRWFKRWFKN